MVEAKIYVQKETLRNIIVRRSVVRDINGHKEIEGDQWRRMVEAES